MKQTKIRPSVLRLIKRSIKEHASIWQALADYDANRPNQLLENLYKSPCYNCIAIKGCNDYSPGRTICAMTFKELAKRAGVTEEEATEWWYKYKLNTK
jgi:hypothetical protein